MNYSDHEQRIENYLKNLSPNKTPRGKKAPDEDGLRPSVPTSTHIVHGTTSILGPVMNTRTPITPHVVGNPFTPFSDPFNANAVYPSTPFTPMFPLAAPVGTPSYVHTPIEARVEQQRAVSLHPASREE